jgi:hypothetical protein
MSSNVTPQSIAQYWTNRADAARKQAAAARSASAKNFWLGVAKINDALAANTIRQETIDRFNEMVAEGADGVKGFVLAVVLGEEGREKMEALGGTSQVAERAAFEFGLKVRPIVRDWLIGQLFGAAGLPGVIKVIGECIAKGAGK